MTVISALCRGSLSLAAFGLLFGCADADAPTPTEETVQICPDVAILGGADFINVYGAPGAENIVYSASLANLDGLCRYDEQGLLIEFSVDVAVSRGPLFPQDPAVTPLLRYVISLVGPGRTMLAREEREVALPLNEEGLRATTTLDVAARYPTVTPEDAATYEVFIGFLPGSSLTTG